MKIRILYRDIVVMILGIAFLLVSYFYQRWLELAVFSFCSGAMVMAVAVDLDNLRQREFHLPIIENPNESEA